MDLKKNEKVEEIDSFLVFLVCFGLYIDVLGVSMRFSIIFCMYEHIKKCIFGFFQQFRNVRS